MSAHPTAASPSPAPVHPNYRLPAGIGRAAWPAMGTTVVVCAPTERLAEAASQTRELFAIWEQALSRFRDDSELAQVNQQAGHSVPVSALFWDVLTTALAAARATDGLYDPTLGRQMLRIGYDRTFAAIAGGILAGPTARPLAGGGWQGMRLDPAARAVTLPVGVALDFGGIAKGMAVDAALAALTAAGIAPALVNAGGDLAANGTPEAGSWSVAVPGDRMIALYAGALATSGTDRRRWQQGATPRHHLIDPRTGEPVVTDVVAVTVAAPRCAQAEVAAKVALILGERAGRAWLRQHHLAGQCLRENGELWATAGWPAKEDQS